MLLSVEIAQRTQFCRGINYPRNERTPLKIDCERGVVTNYELIMGLILGEDGGEVLSSSLSSSSTALFLALGAR